MSEQTPRYGHAPIKMRRVADYSAIDLPGDFAWDVGNILWDVDTGETLHILIAIPSPAPDAPSNWVLNRLPVQCGANNPGKAWGWDGNEDKPTLTPSIHCFGHWHGWVRSGEMVEA